MRILKKFILVIICLIGFGEICFGQGSLKKIKIVSQGTLNGKAIYLPIPVYSKAAAAVNASGTVSILVTIDEKGSVVKAVAQSGHLLLQVESVKSAMQSKFEPIILSGKPINVTGIIQYNYVSHFPPQKYKTEKVIFTTQVLNLKAKVLPMPQVPPIQPRIAGNVVVQVKINLQKGEVVSTNTVSGHPLLRPWIEKSARQAKFEPILTEFDTIYAVGVLVYKVEDLNGKTIENNKPKPILSVVDSRKAIINGKAINLEKPAYPEKAREVCANGKVEILTLIHSVKGDVISAKAISGNKLLFEESEKAVMKSKFTLTNFNGKNDFYVLGKIVYDFDYLSGCSN